MRKFLIKTECGQYEGLFAHCCDAVIDAFERFPGARRVFVKALS